MFPGLIVLNFSILKTCLGENDGHQAATEGSFSKVLMFYVNWFMYSLYVF